MSLAGLCVVIVAVAVVGHAADTKMTAEHSSDMITYLWWALGILGSFAATVSAGTGVWMLLRVLAHDKEIAVIKARCAMHEEEEPE